MNDIQNATPAQIKATALWASLANTVTALKVASSHLEGDALCSATYAIKLAEEKLAKFDRVV